MNWPWSATVTAKIILTFPVTNATDCRMGVATPNRKRLQTVKTTRLIALLSVAIAVLTLFLQSASAQTGPSITQQPASQTNLAGANVTLSVAVSGTGPFSYQWRLNRSDLPNGIITTVAGGGSSVNSGDGGAATNARLGYASGVALDASGNLFISDSVGSIRKVDVHGIITTVAGEGGYGLAADVSGNLFLANSRPNTIRKVATNGIITTVAGNGVSGYSGDGGSATLAELNNPVGVAVDAAGNLFVADYSNSRIRKVDTNGIITTIAGRGTGGYSGDGGAATNATMNYPNAVSLDASGHLFIAADRRIRKVDTNGIITTVAGNGTIGSYGFYGDGNPATNASVNPSGEAVDASGNIYITVYTSQFPSTAVYNSRLRKVDLTGIITTMAGNDFSGYSGDGGPSTNATLNEPSAVAVDSFGNVFIADRQNQSIRKIIVQGPMLELNNLGANNAGNYDVVVTGALGSVTSKVASVTVLAPPVITRQPANRPVLAGGDAAFSVSAIGTMPLSYQWYFNGGALPGQTKSVLNLTNLGTTNEGDYTVVVTNLYGSASSTAAVLDGFGPTDNISGAYLNAASFSALGAFDPPADVLVDLGSGRMSGGASFTGVSFAQAGTPMLVFVFSSFNLNSGVTITFTNYGSGSPAVALLSQGDLYISGSILGDGHEGGNELNSCPYDPFQLCYTPYIAIGGPAGGNTGSGPGAGLPGASSPTTSNPYWTGGGGAITYNSDLSLQLLGGSGGGTGSADSAAEPGIGGSGGGALQIGALGYLSVSGTISANGAPGSGATARALNPYTTRGGGGGGGGSGGGILIHAGKVMINRFVVVSAQGGDGGVGFGLGGGGGGGGGGRIHIAYHNSGVTNGAISVAGGGGASGTIVFTQSDLVPSLPPPPGTPAITNQPQSLMVTLGSTATFSVTASGTGPLSYQWRFNGTNLAGATGSSLTLSNVQPAQTGLYSVVLSNAVGMVTSSNAVLTVLLPSLITMNIPTISGNNLLLGFTLSQTVGGTLTLLQSPNITGPWATNTGAVLTTNAETGLYQFFLLIPGSVEFYQVRSP